MERERSDRQSSISGSRSEQGTLTGIPRDWRQKSSRDCRTHGLPYNDPGRTAFGFRIRLSPYPPLHPPVKNLSDPDPAVGLKHILFALGLGCTLAATAAQTDEVPNTNPYEQSDAESTSDPADPAKTGTRSAIDRFYGDSDTLPGTRTIRPFRNLRFRVDCNWILTVSTPIRATPVTE